MISFWFTKYIYLFYYLERVKFFVYCLSIKSLNFQLAIILSYLKLNIYILLAFPKPSLIDTRKLLFEISSKLWWYQLCWVPSESTIELKYCAFLLICKSRCLHCYTLLHSLIRLIVYYRSAFRLNSK